MSKTLKGGYCWVVGGPPVPLELDDLLDFGSDGSRYRVENSDKRTPYGQTLEFYIGVNDVENSVMLQAIMTDNEETPYTITNPTNFKPNIPETVTIQYSVGSAKYYYVYVYETKEIDIPEKLFNLLSGLTRIIFDIQEIDLSNTDGVMQSCYNILINGVSVGNNIIYPDEDVAIIGANEKNISLRPHGLPASSLVLATSKNLTFKFFSPCVGENRSTTTFMVANNYPHKPIIEQIIHNGVVFIHVTTNVPAHGNIYFNGGAEPAYTYVTSKISPYIAEIKIDKVGAYTANIISEVIVDNQHYYAYGELSDTLITEQQNVDCTLSFNEYTGILSCVPSIEGSVEKFTLQKQSENEWINVSENTMGEFQITESGTYKITPTFGIFYTGTVFPESITVKTTLDAPTAYSDPTYPSQLGFDEVEYANIYDVYRVSEDGDDELVAMISQNNIVSRVTRKEKMFIIIPNDEVKNV